MANSRTSITANTVTESQPGMGRNDRNGMSKTSLLESSLTWLRVLKATRDFMDTPQPLLLLLLLDAAGEQSDQLAVDATDGMETHTN